MKIARVGRVESVGTGDFYEYNFYNVYAAGSSGHVASENNYSIRRIVGIRFDFFTNLIDDCFADCPEILFFVQLFK